MNHIFAPAVVQIVNDYVLAYTSLGVTPPDFPSGPISWPANGVFVTVSPGLITTLGDKAIADVASNLPHTGFSEGPFTGDLGLSLGGLQNVVVLEDGSLVSSIAIGYPLMQKTRSANTGKPPL
jgi:hypothetical protein